MTKIIKWKKLGLKHLAYLCLIIGVIFIIASLISIIYYGKYRLAFEMNNTDIETSANISELIGGIVGPLWTLAGIFLYFSALKLQSKEISNQVQEMSESKRLLTQQQFEITFFNLLNNQQSIKNNINEFFYSVSFNRYFFKGYVRENTKGGDFFARAKTEIIGLYEFFKRKDYEKWNEEDVDEHLNQLALSEEYSIDNDPPDEQESEEEDENNIRKLHYEYQLTYFSKNYNIAEESYTKLKETNKEKTLCAYIYLTFFNKYENSIGHYCRHLYNIVKFLDSYHTALLNDANITSIKDAKLRKKEEDKIEDKIKTYLSFIQSSLSSSEMFLLFYNMLLFDKAETLFVKYDLFENLRKEKLISPEHVELIKNIKLKSKEDLFNRILESIEEEAVPQS